MEFLVDADRRFYFLEMNTRLQVEHPVTELVTGLDLVKLQIEIAAGATLAVHAGEMCAGADRPSSAAFTPKIRPTISCRFPGKITRLAEPAGPGVRLDSGVYEGWTVPMEYDPLLAKLAVWAPTREHATARVVRALSEYDVGGIRTNIGFFRQILEDPEFRAGHLHTGFIDEFFARAKRPCRRRRLEAVAALVAALHCARRNQRAAEPRPSGIERMARQPDGTNCCDEARSHHRRPRKNASRFRPAVSASGDGPERDANVETAAARRLFRAARWPQLRCARGETGVVTCRRLPL